MILNFKFDLMKLIQFHVPPGFEGFEELPVGEQRLFFHKIAEGNGLALDQHARVFLARTAQRAFADKSDPIRQVVFRDLSKVLGVEIAA